VVDVLRVEIGQLQARSDSITWEPGPVLDSPESFLLDGGYQFAAADQRRSDITVVGIDTEDVHIGCLTRQFPGSSG
jgi:hypothetical protein